ncbi:hypothetical protein DSO57_1023950 [Entomophthora muscae]|uniref:Uncharacterized protein n=1 Tax=Entomophthora muscae TaxID=34485 RepID=A0ACC2UNM4_9FUNG|nr:hypothetical protein DSO57_1023950 [Entomophthora muscae]
MQEHHEALEYENPDPLCADEADFVTLTQACEDGFFTCVGDGCLPSTGYARCLSESNPKQLKGIVAKKKDVTDDASGERTNPDNLKKSKAPWFA